MEGYRLVILVKFAHFWTIFKFVNFQVTLQEFDAMNLVAHLIW